ncbi:amidohydrolase family protein [Nocardia nova]
MASEYRRSTRSIECWLRDRLPQARPPRLHALGATMARWGITGVTDATPDLAPRAQEALVDAVATGELPQRLYLLGAPLNATAPQSDSRIGLGPYKIVIADSGLPSLETLVGGIREAHGHGRAVAVHCVSREALLLLVAALDEAGSRPGDRIEHGALVPVESIADVRRHGLRVVTQPGFLRARGDDYVRHVDPVDLPDLYRCRSLLDASVPLALSSDAPYGPIDPWVVVEAAVNRTTATGTVVNSDERVAAAAALRGYLGSPACPGGAPRRVRVGAPADLVVLRVPLDRALRAPSADHVRATIVHGQLW